MQPWAGRDALNLRRRRNGAARPRRGPGGLAAPGLLHRTAPAAQGASCPGLQQQRSACSGHSAARSSLEGARRADRLAALVGLVHPTQLVARRQLPGESPQSAIQRWPGKHLLLDAAVPRSALQDLQSCAPGAHRRTFSPALLERPVLLQRPGCISPGFASHASLHNAASVPDHDVVSGELRARASCPRCRMGRSTCQDKWGWHPMTGTHLCVPFGERSPQQISGLALATLEACSSMSTLLDVSQDAFRLGAEAHFRPSRAIVLVHHSGNMSSLYRLDNGHLVRSWQSLMPGMQSSFSPRGDAWPASRRAAAHCSCGTCLGCRRRVDSSAAASTCPGVAHPRCGQRSAVLG